MRQKKKGLKRKRAKYPGLDKKLHPKVRQEFIDQDYIDRLSDEEKQWLSNFNEEWVGASFTHKGKVFHRSKKAKKECYDRNNARNRDLFAISKASNLLESVSVLNHGYDKPTNLDPNNVEDAVLRLIDDGKKVSEE